MIRVLALLAVLIPGLACAEGIKNEDYVANNILAIFYHEMGHALIDILNLPIFGQEEDAADVVSVLMIHDFFDEDAAVQMAYDTADNFLADSERYGEEGVAYWDTHGPDLQRYYTTICLFVGGNFEERVDIAEELHLPEERLDSCEEEFDLAYGSWGPVLDEISVAGGGDSLKLSQDLPGSTNAQWLYGVMKAEVDSLNQEFKMPVDLDIRIEDCGEPNAFYDLGEKAIIMCTEFAEHLDSNISAQ